MTRCIGLVCVALSACAPAPATPFMAAATSPHVLFVQLGGEVLQSAASDDATTDHSGIALQAPSGVAYVPPFDPNVVAPGIAAADVGDVLFDRLRTLFAPWDVTLTRTKPPSGAYTEIAIGGDFMLVGVDDGVAGLAFGVDCNDANASNVVYDFSDDQSPDFGGVVSVAATAAHEAGHAYGLEHTVDLHDLMYAVASPAQTVPDVFGAAFRESGAYSSFGAGGLSMPESCGRADPVNAGVLAANVGSSTRSDTTKPTLANVSFEGLAGATATDDVGVVRMEVYKNFALVALSSSPSIGTQIAAAGGESYFVTIEAIDAAANRASVTSLVTAPMPPVDMQGTDDGEAPIDAGTDAGMTPSGGCSFAATSPPTSTFAFAFAFAFTFARSRLRQRGRQSGIDERRG
jgi:hypothetical protein